MVFSSALARADTSLNLESALGFTTNGNLSEDNAQSDRIFRVGGVSRFPLPKSQGRFSLRYVDYGKLSENDLLSADLGSTWKTGPLPSDRTYGLRASLRNYVHEDAATNDEAFTHYGVIGNSSWKTAQANNATWEFTPQVDIEHYQKFSSRNDADFSFRFERVTTNMESSEISFGINPGLLLSTESDFTKAYVTLDFDYERSTDTHSWGAYASLTPSFYLARETGTTAILLRNRRNLGGAILIMEKERTTLFSPGAWWAKPLATDWELRLDSSLRFQSSKSGTVNYAELQAGVSINYRAF